MINDKPSSQGGRNVWAANQFLKLKKGRWKKEAKVSNQSARYLRKPFSRERRNQLLFYLPSGGDVPGNAAWGTPAAAAAAAAAAVIARFAAEFWPGRLNWGRKLAKLSPVKGSWPPGRPGGKWFPKAACACCWAACWLAEVARRDKIERSDICKRWATGGILARVAGNLDTSDFMSESSSSSWFSTLWSTALAGLLPNENNYD